MTLTLPSDGPPPLLLVTGLSGAGKTTAMNTLEDLGWETVENLPLALLGPLLEAPQLVDDRALRPLALGVDGRTRDFDGPRLIRLLRQQTQLRDQPVELLFLDCSSAELERRFSRTRRRHPLAPDRPVTDGIARERELLADVRAVADHLIDTTDLQPNLLAQTIRERYRERTNAAPVLAIESFGFSRGLPRNADTVLDVRFLRNPFWNSKLQALTGLDREVGSYIAGDEYYEPFLTGVRSLLSVTLPRATDEGKSYVTVAFGCTGGRHRSVHIAERVADWLRDEGYSPTVLHRDLLLPHLTGATTGDGEEQRRPA